VEIFDLFSIFFSSALESIDLFLGYLLSISFAGIPLLFILAFIDMIVSLSELVRGEQE